MGKNKSVKTNKMLKVKYGLRGHFGTARSPQNKTSRSLRSVSLGLCRVLRKMGDQAGGQSAPLVALVCRRPLAAAGGQAPSPSLPHVPSFLSSGCLGQEVINSVCWISKYVKNILLLAVNIIDNDSSSKLNFYKLWNSYTIGQHTY